MIITGRIRGFQEMEQGKCICKSGVFKKWYLERRREKKEGMEWSGEAGAGGRF